MPADPSITSAPSVHHTSGTAPYVCSTRQEPPASAEWSIQYDGYCRTSLDHHKAAHKVGSSDPRCPADCPHKATEATAIRFTRMFNRKGAQAGAKLARKIQGEM